MGLRINGSGLQPCCVGIRAPRLRFSRMYADLRGTGARCACATRLAGAGHGEGSPWPLTEIRMEAAVHPSRYDARPDGAWHSGRPETARYSCLVMVGPDLCESTGHPERSGQACSEAVAPLRCRRSRLRPSGPSSVRDQVPPAGSSDRRLSERINQRYIGRPPRPDWTALGESAFSFSAVPVSGRS